MDIDNTNKNDVLDDFLMKPGSSHQTINQHFHETVKGAFQIMIMNNCLFVLLNGDHHLKNIKVYTFERIQKRLILALKRQHMLDHEIPSKIINLISTDSKFKQLLEDSTIPTMLFGVKSGCILKINSIGEPPSIAYDLKQNIVGITPIEFPEEMESETEVSSSLSFPQDKHETKPFKGYGLCFVGEKGKISTAIFNPDQTFLQLFIAQLATNIEHCISAGNLIMAASIDVVSIYKVEGRTKISKKQKNDLIHLDFIHLKDYKIMNVKQLMISPVNRNEVICLNSAHEIMTLNFKSSLMCKAPQKSISSLLEAYNLQSERNQNLKEESSTLTRDLMSVSTVGEWVKMLKSDNPTCLIIETSVSRITTRSRNMLILSLKVSNNSPFHIPHNSQLCLQYMKSFNGASSFTNSESLQCTISSCFHQTYNVKIAEQAVGFMPLEFNIYLHFTVGSMPTISCFVKTFQLDVLDFCEVRPIAMISSTFHQHTSKIEKSYRCTLALDTSKRTPDEFQQMVFPILNLSQKNTHYTVDHVNGECADLDIVFGEVTSTLTIISSNIVFLASLHFHLMNCLKVISQKPFILFTTQLFIQLIFMQRISLFFLHYKIPNIIRFVSSKFLIRFICLQILARFWLIFRLVTFIVDNYLFILLQTILFYCFVAGPHSIERIERI